MAELGDWFNQIPPITRYWFAGAVALPVLCRFNLFSPYTMLLTTDFLKNMQLWKPLTSALYYPLSGNKGFNFLVLIYFLYNYSQRLELGLFGGRPADYLFMLIFNWIACVFFGLTFGLYMLLDSMVMSVIYMYCRVNHDQIVSFWFGTRFKAMYLPWALLGMSFLMGDGGIKEFVGIMVGHLYYFIMMKYPEEQGVVLLRTPQILYSYLPSQTSVGFSSRERLIPPSTRSVPTASASANTNNPTGYNWGRGRRLED